jgi:hypothetical protein
VQLFKGGATNGDIDWVITNHPEPNLSTHDLQAKNAVRWQIEQLHLCRIAPASHFGFFCGLSESPESNYLHQFEPLGFQDNF